MYASVQVYVVVDLVFVEEGRLKMTVVVGRRLTTGCTQTPRNLRVFLLQETNPATQLSLFLHPAPVPVIPFVSCYTIRKLTLTQICPVSIHVQLCDGLYFSLEYLQSATNILI